MNSFVTRYPTQHLRDNRAMALARYRAGTEENDSALIIISIEYELKQLFDPRRVGDLGTSLAGANIGIAKRLHPTISINADCFAEGIPGESWRAHASRKPYISKDWSALSPFVLDEVGCTNEIGWVGAPSPVAPSERSDFSH
jgi:hypothetical protein